MWENLLNEIVKAHQVFTAISLLKTKLMRKKFSLIMKTCTAREIQYNSRGHFQKICLKNISLKFQHLSPHMWWMTRNFNGSNMKIINYRKIININIISRLIKKSSYRWHLCMKLWVIRNLPILKKKVFNCCSLNNN